jgi:hypothetical protein
MAATDITQPQFILRVSKICRRAWVTILDNFAKYSSWQDPKVSKRKRFEEAVQLSLMAGIDFHIFDQIRNLGAPKGDEREIEEIIGPMQSAVEREQKKLVPISSVAQVSAPFDGFNQRASEYGIDDCRVNENRLKKIET